MAKLIDKILTDVFINDKYNSFKYKYAYLNHTYKYITILYDNSCY